MKWEALNYMKKQITINQHYVPRFYMKPFAEVIRKNSNNEKALIAFYQFKDKIVKDKIPTTSICSKDYFYDKDGHIENKLADKETIWSRAISKFNKNEEVTEEKVQSVREFIIYQIVRTKVMLEYTQEMATVAIADSLFNISHNLDRDKIRNLVEERVNGEITPEFILELADALIPSIIDLDIIMIKNNTKIPFITSDVPIIVVNPLGVTEAGLEHIGEVIFFPISESKLILCYDSKVYGKIRDNIDEEDTIHTFNKYQYVSAGERILSLKSSNFLVYTEDEELNKIRNRFQLKTKTNTTCDGAGTFIAAKGRSINYYYDIPILKLPIQLRKIPEKYRKTFSRKYSRETRTFLLCQIYRQPDFITNDVIKKDWKDRQKYSKQLLRYFDYYWQTPKEDTVIGKDYMYKLRTVPVKMWKTEMEDN